MEELTREKRKRGCHRGQLTKLFSRSDDLFTTGDLDSIHAVLKLIDEKITLLEKVDDTIINLSDGDQLEEVIVEADDYIARAKEKLYVLNKKQGKIESTQNAADTSQTESQPSTAVPATKGNSYRLPKLTIARFNGDMLNWQTFEDDYSSAIGSNGSLSPIEKFQFLRAQLEGEAYETIAGLQLTDANYEHALALLKERYGQKHRIVNAYMHALWQLPKASNDVKGLTNFLDKLETYVRGLTALGKEENGYEELLVPMLLDRIHHDVRKQITRTHGSTEFTLKDLRKAIKSEIEALQAGNIDNMQPYDSEYGYRPSTAAFYTHTRRAPKQFAARNNISTCAFCKANHSSFKCQVIVDVDKRYEIVKRDKLCFNCLSSKHIASECRSKHRCRNCDNKHHTALCKPNPHFADKSPIVEHATLASTGKINHKSPVLLKTAVASVSAGTLSTDVSVLFDEGATRSFVTQQLADKLNLRPTRTEEINLAVFGDNTTHARRFDIVTISVKTTCGNYINMNAIVVPDISTPLQNLVTRDVARLPHLRNLRLAYPPSDTSMIRISILIGADHYWDFVLDTVIRGHGPTAVASKLGYLLSGPAHTEDFSPRNAATAFHVFTRPKEDDTLERFWTLESVGISDCQQSTFDSSDLRSFQNTYIEKGDEQYIAKLPWKNDHQALPTNYSTAAQRTRNMLRKLPEETRRVYHKIITDQETRGFIERVHNDDNSAGHYLPHHPVKKDSVTTPIRIVYDCSTKASRDEPSLNDCLYKGPPLLNDLTGILLRFRLHKIAYTSDIEKAFLNVGLHEDDRDYTKFLWLEDAANTESKFIVYRFSSVLFGSVSSPAILNAVIRTHLDQSESDISNDLKQDIYVDNIVSGTDCSHKAMKFYNESNELLESAGFKLRSWASNDPQIRQAAEKDGISLQTDEQTTPILGLLWNTENDTLAYKPCTYVPDTTVTKRQVIRHVSRIYDPLGLLAPVLVRAKIFIQELWKAGLDWDDNISQEMTKTWTEIAYELGKADRITVPRQYFQANGNETNPIELHCFVDASIKAYGTAIYLKNGDRTSLIIAKSRVAPVKEITLPRLELMAAVLGARLTGFVHSHLKDIAIAKYVLWSDSQIVLCWINSNKHLPIFVRNRVNEVKSSLFNDFKYCPTADNPADLVTRGISAKSLQASPMWWNGPTWLGIGDWPIGLTYNNTVMLQHEDNRNEIIQPDNEISHSIANVIDITRYSKLQQLLNVTALVLRFTKLVKGTIAKPEKMTPSVQEILNAENMWIKHIQAESFDNEIKSLKETMIKSTPIVRQLRLFLDESNVLRLGGRLHNAPIPYDAKHPSLLPRHHPYTKLVIHDAHSQVLHSGMQSTTTHIRQRHWIPQIRQTVSNILRHCVTCRRLTCKPFVSPVSPPLRSFRVNNTPPFTFTGVDFTGALHVTSGKTVVKAYICLFTCASTRAIHIEIVNDMSTISFLNAFRRFAARRSLPTKMISDNASTYQSAAHEIKTIFESAQVQGYLNNHRVEWEFIPKRAPWFGGFWERLIGLTKSALKKTIGRANITLEELRTLATEIEATLNDRPMTYVSDGEPLTPSMLLHGRLLRTLPHVHMDQLDDPSYGSDNHTRNLFAKRMQYVGKVYQHFSQRWATEYLTALRERDQAATGTTVNNIKVGAVVLVHSDEPRLKWNLAVVMQLVYGNDGLVRSARIKTKSGVTNRPITKLYPLEVSTDLYNDNPNDRHDRRATNNEDRAAEQRPVRQAAMKARETIRGWTMNI